MENSVTDLDFENKLPNCMKNETCIKNTTLNHVYLFLTVTRKGDRPRLKKQIFSPELIGPVKKKSKSVKEKKLKTTSNKNKSISNKVIL